MPEADEYHSSVSAKKKTANPNQEQFFHLFAFTKYIVLYRPSIVLELISQ